jgi:hypothetical protein
MSMVLHDIITYKLLLILFLFDQKDWLQKLIYFNIENLIIKLSNGAIILRN